jgi:hypothetical protein
VAGQSFSKQDSDRFNLERNLLVSKQKTNAAEEVRRFILSAHGLSMSGSEQKKWCPESMVAVIFLWIYN